MLVWPTNDQTTILPVNTIRPISIREPLVPTIIICVHLPVIVPDIFIPRVENFMPYLTSFRVIYYDLAAVILRRCLCGLRTSEVKKEKRRESWLQPTTPYCITEIGTMRKQVLPLYNVLVYFLVIPCSRKLRLFRGGTNDTMQSPAQVHGLGLATHAS